MDGFRQGLERLVGVVLVVALVSGVVVLGWKLKKSDEVVVEVLVSPTPVQVVLGTEVVVEVSGQVMEPGVFTLDANARVDQAIVAAGGLGASADRDWVEKYINRAAKVSDGMKIYIPKVGEMAKIAFDGAKTEGFAIQDINLRKIDINSANQSELEGLWGVGQATAKKIISGRPYKSVDELLTRKIVKKNVFEEIKDEVAVY